MRWLSNQFTRRLICISLQPSGRIVAIFRALDADQLLLVEAQLAYAPQIASKLVDDRVLPLLGGLELIVLRAVAAIPALAVMRKPVQPSVALRLGRYHLKTENGGLQPRAHLALELVACQRREALSVFLNQRCHRLTTVAIRTKPPYSIYVLTPRRVKRRTPPGSGGDAFVAVLRVHIGLC